MWVDVRREAVWIVCLAAVTVGVTALVLDLGGNSAIQLSIVLAALLAALPFVLPLTGRRFDVFEPPVIFAFCFAVFFVGQPIYDVVSGQVNDGFLGYDVVSILPRALLAASVGCAAFYAAYYLGPGKRLAERTRTPSGEWDVPSTKRAVRFLAVISLILFAYYAHKHGGLSFITGLVSNGRNAARSSTLQSTSGYLTSAQFWCEPLGLLYLALQPKWRSFKAIPGWGLFFFSIITNIGSGDRSVLLPAAGALVILYYLRQGRRPSMRFVLIAVIIVYIFGISLPRVHRAVNDEGGSTSWGSALSTSVFHPDVMATQLFGGADTAMVDSFAAEMQIVPGQLHYRYGKTYLGALARPIPHSIYKNKPPAADSVLNETLYPAAAENNVGFAFSVFAEPWLNGAWLGEIIVLGIFGVVMRFQYEWMMRTPRNVTSSLIYALTIPYIINYMRGGFGVTYQSEVIALLPLLLVYWYAHPRRQFGKRASSTSGPFQAWRSPRRDRPTSQPVRQG